MLRRRLYKKGSVDYSGAVAGDVLCSDHSWVTSANYASSGKTAIGIVFSNASGKLKAIALGYSNVAFSPDVDIVALTDFSTPANAITDTDGKANTDALIGEIGSSTSYAAGYCRAYYTTETTAGDWFLPSAGEWNTILTKITSINAGLTAAGANIISTSNYEVHWTSTDGIYSNDWAKMGAWACYKADGTIQFFNIGKKYAARVFPAITINY